MTVVMRDADARFAASTITSNSIRFSEAGGQVGWMMKVSRPADIFEDLDVDLAVRETPDVGSREWDPQATRDIVGELRVRVARKNRHC